MDAIYIMRKALNGLKPDEAVEKILDMFVKTNAGSSPPDNVLPEGGTVRLYARASLVMLSRRIMTSFLCSTSLFARRSSALFYM